MVQGLSESEGFLALKQILEGKITCPTCRKKGMRQAEERNGYRLRCKSCGRVVFIKK